MLFRSREVKAVARLLHTGRKQYDDDPPSAKKFVSTGLAPRPAEINVSELAAWTAVARVLFNLDETLMRN